MASTTQQPACATGIILAGGSSRRMGRDKAMLRLHGETLLTRAARVVGETVDEVTIVGGPSPDLPGNIRYFSDEYPGSGPLGGILTGLRHATHPHALVVACDLPFLQPALLRLLLHRARGYDAVIPNPAGQPQPTLAVYAREVVPIVEEQLMAGQFQMKRLLDRLRVCWIGEDDLARVDPEGLSFQNINTPADWEQTRQRAGHR